MHIYLAGPIDYLTGDADDRHKRLRRLLADWGITLKIFCPHCQYDPGRMPVESIAANMRALDAAEVLFVVWDAVREPSFGTPVEIWRYVKRDDPVVIVLGDLGRGLFARQLRERGVQEVGTWQQAMRILKERYHPEA